MKESFRKTSFNGEASFIFPMETSTRGILMKVSMMDKET
jgi:hypothetical protein